MHSRAWLKFGGLEIAEDDSFLIINYTKEICISSSFILSKEDPVLRETARTLGIDTERLVNHIKIYRESLKDKRG